MFKIQNYSAFLFYTLCGLNMFYGTALAQSHDTDIRPQAQQLVDDELRLAFEGRTHDGAYNFNSEGLASRFYEETHHSDGRLTYKEGDDIYSGKWGLQKDGICFIYTDERLRGGCYRVYRVKNCYYFYSKHWPQFPDEIDRDYWTARSVLNGESADCIAAVS